MSIVGPDGQTPVFSDVEMMNYSVGGMAIKSADAPEVMFRKALAGAQQMMGQQAAAMAFERTKSHVVAQTEGQQAASQLTNPFQLEPCALGVFMLMSREIEHRDKIIVAFAERLDKLDGQRSEDLLKNPWPDPPEESQENDAEQTEESEDSNDVFSQAAKNMTQNAKKESN